MDVLRGFLLHWWKLRMALSVLQRWLKNNKILTSTTIVEIATCNLVIFGTTGARNTSGKTGSRSDGKTSRRRETTEIIEFLESIWKFIFRTRHPCLVSKKKNRFDIERCPSLHPTFLHCIFVHRYSASQVPSHFSSHGNDQIIVFPILHYVFFCMRIW